MVYVIHYTIPDYTRAVQRTTIARDRAALPLSLKTVQRTLHEKSSTSTYRVHRARTSSTREKRAIRNTASDSACKRLAFPCERARIREFVEKIDLFGGLNRNAR